MLVDSILNSKVLRLIKAQSWGSNSNRTSGPIGGIFVFIYASSNAR
jgi:hypothetical protein